MFAIVPLPGWCDQEQERSSTIQQLDTTRELLATATAAALAAAEQRLLDAQALGAAQLVAAQACSAVELAAVQASSAALLATARAAEAALSARVAELDGVAGEGQRALETLRGCQRTLDARCVLAEERAKVAELSLSEWRGLDGERKRITVQREENLALISKVSSFTKLACCVALWIAVSMIRRNVDAGVRGGRGA